MVNSDQLRLLSVSPSRLGQWLDCPRAYRLTYLDRPRPTKAPQRAIISIGNSAHATLARFWDLDEAERTPPRVLDVLQEVWQDTGFANPAQSAYWRTRVGSWLVDYLRGQDRDTQPVAVERTVGMPTSALAITGRVDRVDERDGELVVVDYKTGGRPLEQGSARTSLAMGLYALALSRMFRRPVWQVELHHLPTGQIDAYRHTPESLERKRAEAESIGLDLRQAEDTYRAESTDSPLFEPRVSALCQWCPVQAHCGPGLAVGPPHPGWAGLEALDAIAGTANPGTTNVRTTNQEDAAP